MIGHLAWLKLVWPVVATTQRHIAFIRDAMWRTDDGSPRMTIAPAYVWRYFRQFHLIFNFRFGMWLSFVLGQTATNLFSYTGEDLPFFPSFMMSLMLKETHGFYSLSILRQVFNWKHLGKYKSTSFERIKYHSRGRRQAELGATTSCSSSIGWRLNKAWLKIRPHNA